MNFLRVTPPLVISFLSFAAFATAGCSDKNKASEVKINISSDAQSAGDTMSAVATNVKETASDTWARIKDDTFDQRADFQSGYQQLISDSRYRNPAFGRKTCDPLGYGRKGLGQRHEGIEGRACRP